MNWFLSCLRKESRRRFKPSDRVRFFTDGRKGTGKGVVLTPNFQRGRVIDYNPEIKRYLVSDDVQQRYEVHPRNIVHDAPAVGRPASEII